MVEIPVDRISSFLTAVLFLALMIGFPGCAGDQGGFRPPLMPWRVVTDPPEVTRSKIGQAESLSAQGNYRGALDSLLATLSRAGTPDLRRRIQELRIQVKHKAIGQILEARVVADSDRIISGRPLNFTLELLNNGAEPITIPRSSFRSRLLIFRKEVGRTVINLKVKMEEYDPRGTHFVARFNQFLELEEDIVIEPGGRWSRSWTARPESLRPETLLLKRIQVEALIRPVRVVVGEQDFYTSIPLESSVVFLLPRGSEVICENPFKHLRLALLRSRAEPRFLPHVLVAASVLEGEDRDRAHEVLGRISREGPDLLRPSADKALALFWEEETVRETPKPSAVLFKTQ